MGNRDRRWIVFLLLIVASLLSGCTESQTKRETEEQSSLFKMNGELLYGEKGKFGIRKLNGENDEPEFPAGKGRHYHIQFLEQSEQLEGKTYYLSALHQETGQKNDLYEVVIENGQSGAKLVFDQSGAWEVQVAVDGEPYAQFTIQAE